MTEENKPAQIEDMKQTLEKNDKPVDKTSEVLGVEKNNEQIDEKIEEIPDIIKPPVSNPAPEQKIVDEPKEKKPKIEEPKIKSEPQIEAKTMPVIDEAETEESQSPIQQDKIAENKQDLETDKKEETAQPATLAVKQAPAKDQDNPSIMKTEKVEIPFPVSPPVHIPMRPKTTKPPVTTAPKTAKANKSETSFAIQYLNKLKEQLGLANLKRNQKARKNLDKIMEYAIKTQRITNDDVEKITGVKDSQATNYLNKLMKQGKLTRFGKTKNTFYKPIIN